MFSTLLSFFACCLYPSISQHWICFLCRLCRRPPTLSIRIRAEDSEVSGTEVLEAQGPGQAVVSVSITKGGSAAPPREERIRLRQGPSTQQLMWKTIQGSQQVAAAGFSWETAAPCPMHRPNSLQRWGSARGWRRSLRHPGMTVAPVVKKKGVVTQDFVVENVEDGLQQVQPLPPAGESTSGRMDELHLEGSSTAGEIAVRLVMSCASSCNKGPHTYTSCNKGPHLLTVHHHATRGHTHTPPC